MQEPSDGRPAQRGSAWAGPPGSRLYGGRRPPLPTRGRGERGVRADRRRGRRPAAPARRLRPGPIPGRLDRLRTPPPAGGSLETAWAGDGLAQGVRVRADASLVYASLIV